MARSRLVSQVFLETSVLATKFLFCKIFLKHPLMRSPVVVIEGRKKMGDKGKCTFGTRMPIDANQLNEIIYREVKHFRNYKTYTPNFGSLPLTGKFYAAHDQLLTETPEETKKVDFYHHKVSQTRAMGPRSKYPYPATGNQEYGWDCKPLMRLDRNDRRFYKPHVDSHHTKVEVIIAMANPKNRA